MECSCVAIRCARCLARSNTKAYRAPTIRAAMETVDIIGGIG